jgi:hypothetical protein
MLTKCLNPFVDEDLKQFLDILNEFGFQFRHERKYKMILIKGKVVDAGCNKNRNFYISVVQADREFIVVESDHYYSIILRTPDKVKEFAIPKDAEIEFRDSNLVIEY